MAILVAAAASAGAFAFTLALWLTGYGARRESAADRLGRIRNPETSHAGSQRNVDGAVARRRRALPRLGNVNLVSSRMAERWSDDLARAGLTLQVKEYWIFRNIAGLGVGAVLFMLVPVPGLQFVFGAAGFAIGVYLPAFWIRMRIAGRRKRLEAQLVEMLPLVASGLRSGFGLVQAIESSTDQIRDPLRGEFQRALRDIAVGSTVESALEALAKRVDSRDFEIVTTAILIQRSVGGNLGQILDGVAETMRERERIRGEIRTLTSQQRLTGYVIGALPVAMFGAFYLLNPDFEKLLITEPIGRGMLGGAVIAEAIGFAIIMRIIKIEV